MSGAHPFWPELNLQQPIAKAFTTSTASSASMPQPAHSQRIPDSIHSAPTNPSSKTISSVNHIGTERVELVGKHGKHADRRSKRTSLDRPHLQATSHAASASALASSSLSHASQNLTELPTGMLPSQPHNHHLGQSERVAYSSSPSVISPINHLPFSSSHPSSPTPLDAQAVSKGIDSTQTYESTPPHPTLHSNSIQAHTSDDPRSSYTQPKLSSTSSISSSHSQHLQSQSPSDYSSYTKNLPSSHSAVPIPSSSSSATLNFASSRSSDSQSFQAASPVAVTDMRYNITTFDPSPPPSSFSARRDASFTRLRSGSGSIFDSSRAATAGDAEVSINVLLWWPSTSKNSSSTLAKAPLFRDAANVKQKLSMRTSSSQSHSSEPGHEILFERASFGFRSGGASWLRDKSSKGRLNSPSSSVGPLGQWKRAILLFRENGSLAIFGEAHALTHTLNCNALFTSDVRSVDDSLFGRPHVLAIHPRQSRGKTEVSITTRKQEAAALSNGKSQRSDTIFVEFTNEEQLQYVKALLHIYAQPEIYGSAATIDVGGTHRFFRQLDITISDAKSIMPKWPAELGDTGPELPSTPPTTPGNRPLKQGQYPSSPTSSTAGNMSTSSEAPRSLSYQLNSMRSGDQDDSPGSEALTEDALSGSSRAGSCPPSRPASRLRHNAKPSVSSIRAQHDLDDNAGSGFSRPASRAASQYDSQSIAGDEASSNGEHISGPVSGHSGASRFANVTQSVSGNAPSINTSISGNSSFAAALRASAQAQRRDDKDRFEKARFDRYCRVRLDGELVARTSLSHTGANAFAVDKFQLKDVGNAKSLIIEVLYPTQKAGGSLAGSPSQSAIKYILLGLVEIPIETLRRNEDVDGRFPVWSASTFPSLSPAHEDDGRVPTTFHRGVVGELSLTIRLYEGAIMPLSMYEEVYTRLHSDDAAEMVKELSTTMREDRIVSHLIRIFAASGTIAERISSLIESESVNWGEKMEPELLFRANTLLSRSVDHFQRLQARSWLDDCLGPTVRKICHIPNAPARPDTATSIASTGSGGGGEGHFDSNASIRSPPLLPANAIDAIPDGPMTTSSLRKLSETMWQNIYRQRHSCPPDLRTVLHQIRCKVNERYRSSKSTRPGIQGVGAFVFLRLFCAALNAPQLYGLTPSQPGRNAQRKLLLLSKVLLALASKKTAFDKDKDWELVPLNDLLRTYSSAYDDYISVVSTEPPTAAPSQFLGIRMEDDADLQAAVQRKLNTSLSRIHREAIPKGPYMLDQAQALSSFICFVADAAGNRDADLYNDALVPGGDDDFAIKQDSASRPDPKQKAREFVQICCRIEEAAGTCIEQAGYDPRPIPFERLQRAAAMPYHAADASVGSFSSSPSSFVTVVGRDGDASPRSSPSRARSRRATVSASNARSRMTDARADNDDPWNESSLRGARRKSFGLPRSGRRPSQATDSTIALGRRTSEMREAITMTHRHSVSARATDLLSATSSRHPFVRQGEEDEHGSDDELRQAYRMLQAEEAAAAATISTAAADVSELPGARHFGSAEIVTDTDEQAPAVAIKPMVALLEADGSSFVPVYPQRSPATTLGPPLSRSVRQSLDLATPTSQQPSFTMSSTATTRRIPKVVDEADSEARMSAHRLGSRAPFTTVSGKHCPPAISANESRNDIKANRRHSSDHLRAPRNYSLPKPLADRKNSTQYEMRESSDGFESVMEDAHAQTRASLPPSASMPTVTMGMARNGNAAGHKAESGQKKKKWWKP
ncbi:related to GTPase activating protein [Melanopsichium pennsylvanicum]|uniref:Related to GTPase activating protein n=2 Tax=Melanopsichium pennsylvanicum TaxID=63383 RepID=A0AAJ4XPZ3_9BASI|nr:related to GTPase activating protein [Melanopsichium pennsylvanicum 4]SNX86380.1 related to GTPase activating protein [Melanopsichium pennsylvanicum]